MPVSKKRTNITELLNFAVEQRQKLQETKIDILQRPGSIWLRSKVVPCNGHMPNNDKDEPKSSTEFIHKIVGATPDKVILFSRQCEIFYEHLVTRVIRCCVTLIAAIVMANEASKSHFSNDDVSVFFVLENFVNAWFMMDSMVCFCGVPIRVKIEEAFQREVTTEAVIVSSGTFSFIMAIVCFSLGQSWEAVWFHLIRLMLMTSALLELVPHIDVLMSGISNGIKSILFTILLLFVTIFIYGVFGMFFFADNDPYHFGTVLLSVWSFFQVATFDQWTDIFYVNYVGCDKFPTEYVMYDGVDRSPVLAAFPNIVDPFAPVHTAAGSFILPICSEPHGQPVIAAILFSTFIFLAGYCMMSLNLAAVAIGINERLEELRGQELYGAVSEEKKITATVTEAPKAKRRDSVTAPNGKNSKADKMTGGAMRIAEMKKMLNNIWAEDSHGEEPIDLMSVHILRSWKYKLFINLCMIAEVILEIADISSFNGDPTASLTFHILFQLTLSFDVGLNFYAFYTDKELAKVLFLSLPTLSYEAVVTLILWSAVFGSPYSEVLGVLRVVRLSTILTNMGYVLHDLKIILQAFASSLIGLSYVLCLVGLFFFYFSVAGTALFKESDPYSFATVAQSLRSLLQVITLDNVGHMMRRNMLGCAAYGYSTDIEAFNALCHHGRGVGWVSAVYFALFIILGSMVLISLLVGVIITSMELLREDVLEAEGIWKEVDVVKSAFELSDVAVKMMLALFEKIDDNGDSTISFVELQPLMFAVDIPEQDQLEFFGHVDRDDSGQIDFAEFCEIISIIGYALKRTAFAKKSTKGEEEDSVSSIDPISAVRQELTTTRRRKARHGRHGINSNVLGSTSYSSSRQPHQQKYDSSCDSSDDISSIVRTYRYRRDSRPTNDAVGASDRSLEDSAKYVNDCVVERFPTFTPAVRPDEKKEVDVVETDNNEVFPSADELPNKLLSKKLSAAIINSEEGCGKDLMHLVRAISVNNFDEAKSPPIKKPNSNTNNNKYAFNEDALNFLMREHGGLNTDSDSSAGALHSKQQHSTSGALLNQIKRAEAARQVDTGRTGDCTDL